jgi:protein-disulfide isomerase
MRACLLRLVLAGLVLAASPAVNVAAVDAPRAADAEQARIEQAVQAYAGKLKADQEKASDRAVAGRITQLLNDPQTQFFGNRDGDVAVVEFFDYTCPFCKAIEPRLQALVKNDKGVKLILKDFPILAPESIVAAKAALASVKQGKFEAFHHAMMGFKGRLEVSTIFEIAMSIGLDVDRLRKDMIAPEIADQIIANFNLARALNITTTPTFIVDAHIVVQPSGQIDFPQLVAETRAN